MSSTQRIARVELGKLRKYPKDIVQQLRSVQSGTVRFVTMTNSRGETVNVRAVPLRVEGDQLVEDK